jgi:S-adenosylmethionine-diacylgycerolhomoserine-N-methlytransferase
MIPDWRAAIANALAMLKPGGMLGVVDFYVSEATPPDGCVRHDAITRAFWPRWFAHDGVKLSDAHLPTLRASVARETLIEARAKVPFLPVGRVPYYVFVGRRR